MSPLEVDLLIERYLASPEAGYLFGFSYSEHERFYTVHCEMPGVDVMGMRKIHGTTKRTFRAILQEASPVDQARIIRGVFTMLPPESFTTDDAPKRVEVATRLRAVADRLDGMVVPAVDRIETTETVQRAIANAEELLRTAKPADALDRVHTALHGHLGYLCREAGITVQNADPEAQHYLNALINEHPKLQVTGPRRDEVKRILRTSMAIIAAISTIRNNASLAHPTEALLDEDEALFSINVAKSLLRYLDAKLGTTA